MEYFIDALGDFCPIPMIKFQAALAEAGAGDKITLISDHSCTVTTLKQETRKKRVKLEVEEIENGIWKIIVIVP